jgi:hypothetical protein
MGKGWMGGFMGRGCDGFCQRQRTNALRGLELRGCRVWTWVGGRVSLCCFRSMGGRGYGKAQSAKGRRLDEGR